jgi:transcription elongation GreA/GreB family factor
MSNSNMVSAMPPPIELATIRSRTSDLLNQLGAKLMRRLPDASDGKPRADVPDPMIDRLRAAIARIGRIASGLAIIDPECIPAEGAGYGSDVKVVSLDSGRYEEYTLLTSAVMDIESSHVSLASPIGQALLGRVPGEEVTICTPQRRARMRVASVRTLTQILDSIELELLDA